MMRGRQRFNETRKEKLFFFPSLAITIIYKKKKNGSLDCITSHVVGKGWNPANTPSFAPYIAQQAMSIYVEKEHFIREKSYLKKNAHTNLMVLSQRNVKE